VQPFTDDDDVAVSPWTVMMRWRVLKGLWVRRMSSSVAAMYL
jgi:hypothetical protein